MSNETEVEIRVKTADALTFKSDVLVLKHAQALYGVDSAVVERLAPQYPRMRLPKIGKELFVDTLDLLGTSHVLFIGVEPLHNFGYTNIRKFGLRALSMLPKENPNIKHVALTIHGPGYGLDEIEAFESELAGVIEAISTANFPSALTRITFVERDARRTKRLSSVLSRLIPNGYLETTGRGPMSRLRSSAQNSLRSAGQESESKPRVFVAMPFAAEMEDVFHFGLQGAVNAVGMLAERSDLSVFTGDVMDWVKTRISTAALVIADLSSNNPNVYLEVGYAWGRGIPTVLLVRNTADLKFDVRGQRCVSYTSIKDLHEKLTRELKGLTSKRTSKVGIKGTRLDISALQ